MVSGSTSGRLGTPWGTISSCRSSTPYERVSMVAAAWDITTVVVDRSTSVARISRCDGVGRRSTVWSVVTTGRRSARTKSRTYAPSGPPQIPYSCWIEITSMLDALSEAAAAG